MTNFKLPPLKEQLEQAEYILAQLDSGRMAIEVKDANGVNVRYNQAHRPGLLVRIEKLKAKLGIPSDYRAIRVR